ncbi:MAG: flagellar export apparatus protein FliQ [Rhizobiales bacterium]|nr:flagellar export apparatus protein FliQ [Hyphomicrobiales bacterium]
MNETDAIEMLQAAVWATCLVAGPVILPAMFVGVLVAMLQAVTQIQEGTLTFLPKMAVAVVAAFMASSLIGSQLVLLTERSYGWIASGF